MILHASHCNNNACRLPTESNNFSVFFHRTYERNIDIGYQQEIMRVFIVLSTDGSLIGCFSCGVDAAECCKRTGGHVHVCALNEELSAGFVSPDANQVSTWGSECEGWEKY